MSWLSSLTPKRRKGNVKRSRRKTAKPGTWKSNPENYAKRKNKDRGKGLKPTDNKFFDSRTSINDVPIYMREQRYSRSKISDDWKPVGEMKRQVISLATYRHWMSDDSLAKIEESGNYVRVLRNADGTIMRRELMFGNQLVMIVTEFRTNNSPDLKSFDRKC